MPDFFVAKLAFSFDKYKGNKNPDGVFGVHYPKNNRTFANNNQKRFFIYFCTIIIKH